MAPGGGSKRKKKLVRTKRVSKTDTTSDGEQQHTSLSEEQGRENHHEQQEPFKQKQSLQNAPELDEQQQQKQPRADVNSHGSKDNDENLGDVSTAEAEVHHDAECGGDDKSECSGSYYEDVGRHLVLEDELNHRPKHPHGTHANSYPRAKFLIRKDTVIQAVPRAREEDFSDLARTQTPEARSRDEFVSEKRSPSVPRHIPNTPPTQTNGLISPGDSSPSPKSSPANASIPGQPVPKIVSSCLQALPWRKGLTTADQMGDQNQAHQLSNPKWRRAAVRAVQIQETKKGENNGSAEAGPHHYNNIQSLRHPATKFQTGNGGIVNSDLPHDIPPPPPVPGTIPHVPPPPPPPEPWNQIGVLGLESYPPPCHGGQHNSVLVDMGKVVGVLRSHGPRSRQPPPEQSFEEGEEEEEEEVEHKNAAHLTNDHGGSGKISEGTCASCSGVTNSNDALDDSLCGDPLMYATFVAPVQQYSTDTEPSRQPSFNYPSRHSSFKQNSSENENTNHQNDSSYAPFPGLPQVHHPCQSHSHNYSDEVQDIYEKVPVEQWPLPPIPKSGSGRDNHDECVEISQEELDHQVAQERLSFISGSSNNEEDEEDEEDENEDEVEEEEEEEAQPSFPALPPLPPTPKDLPSQSSPFTFAQEASLDQWGSGEDSETTFSTAGTVRRKNKRERNRTTVVEQPNEPCCRHNRSKSRSKSRSPGRTIDTAIVIVHHRRTNVPGTGARGSTSRVGGSRGTSPDNISESSVSFHENELGSSSKSEASGLPPGKPAYPKSAQVQSVSYPCPPVAFPRQSDPHQPNDGNGPFMAMFANRDSVRESWMSSGSEYQGSGASSGSNKPMQSVGNPRSVQTTPPTSAVKPCDLYQQYNSAPMRHVMSLSSPMAAPAIGYVPMSSAECSVPTTPFLNARSPAQSGARTSGGGGGGSLPRKRTPPTNLGNRSILRSSSREMGSSWSVHRSTSRLNRGGGSTMSLQPRHSHSQSGTPEGEQLQSTKLLLQNKQPGTTGICKPLCLSLS